MLERFDNWEKLVISENWKKLEALKNWKKLEAAKTNAMNSRRLEKAPSG